MKTFGIICEYNPFHRGHEKHFRLIRHKYPDALIVCLMSGCFTQRGSPALFSPIFRARQALLGGADLVLELPCAFAVSDAERFALAGVDILSRLQFVDTLSFGCEDSLELLKPIALLLEDPPPSYTGQLKEALSQGLSFPAAQATAVKNFSPEAAFVLSKPNNILAICYLRALLRLSSTMELFTVTREGNYHDSMLHGDDNPSASAIRNAFLSGQRQAAEAACGYSLTDSAYCTEDALDKLLLWKLRTQSPEQLSRLSCCNEGLENRLFALSRQCVSRKELLEKIKTKRYPQARLSRLLCHALLGITEDFLQGHAKASYVRILAARPERIRGLLSNSQIPILAKAAQGDRRDELFLLDETAYDLWALGAGLPAGRMYKEPIVIL